MQSLAKKHGWEQLVASDRFRQSSCRAGNLRMLQPFLLDRISLWGYSYPIPMQMAQPRSWAQTPAAGQGKSQWLGGIQWRMCGLPSSTWQFLWRRWFGLWWFGLRLCSPCSLQRHAGSMPHPWSSKDLFRALRVLMQCPRWWLWRLEPRKRRKTARWSRDVRLPRRGWKPWSLQISNQCGTGTLSSFLIGSLFSHYLFLWI